MGGGRKKTWERFRDEYVMLLEGSGDIEVLSWMVYKGKGTRYPCNNNNWERYIGRRTAFKWSFLQHCTSTQDIYVMTSTSNKHKTELICINEIFQHRSREE